jgi:hypothetical protein
MIGTPVTDSSKGNPMMSPTQYQVSRAKLDAELEAARKAGDVPRMQMSLAGLTALRRAMYGLDDAPLS